MPFRSDAQRKFMYAQHPDIAKRWSAEYGSMPQKNGYRKAGSQTPKEAGPQ